MKIVARDSRGRIGARADVQAVRPMHVGLVGGLFLLVAAAVHLGGCRAPASYDETGSSAVEQKASGDLESDYHRPCCRRAGHSTNR